MHGSKPVDVPATDHLVLLAPDPAGYAAISRFVTRGQFRGKKDLPAYDYAELDEASRDGNLVALTGCRDGAVPRAAQAGDLAGAMAAAARLREVFPGRLYIELTHHGMPDDDDRNDLLSEVSRTAPDPVCGHQQRALRPAPRCRSLRGPRGGRRQARPRYRQTASGPQPI